MRVTASLTNLIADIARNARVSAVVSQRKFVPISSHVIDEAHHLRNDMLEDLRLLTNYQMDAENRLSTVAPRLPPCRAPPQASLFDRYTGNHASNPRASKGYKRGPTLGGTLRKMDLCSLLGRLQPK